MRGLYPNDVTKSPIASLTRESSSMIEIMEAFIKSASHRTDYLIRASAVGGNKIVKQQEMIRYYLSHPEEASAIASRGRERCVAEHRWLHRYCRICEILGILPDPAPHEENGDGKGP